MAKKPKIPEVDDYVYIEFDGDQECSTKVCGVERIGGTLILSFYGWVPTRVVSWKRDDECWMLSVLNPDIKNLVDVEEITLSITKRPRIISWKR